MHYQKQSLPVQYQIQQLKSRGLRIVDESFAVSMADLTLLLIFCIISCFMVTLAYDGSAGRWVEHC